MITKIKLQETANTISDFTGFELVVLFKDASGKNISTNLQFSKVGELDFTNPINFSPTDKISFAVKAPAGNIIFSDEVENNVVFNQPLFLIKFNKTNVSLDNASTPFVPKSSSINGRLLDSTGKLKLDEVQIIVSASDPATPDLLTPILSTITEAGGYFVIPIPVGDFGKATATIGANLPPGKNIILINLVKNDAGKLVFPKRLLLVVESSDENSVTLKSDCGCEEINLYEQKRVLDEFSYYSIIRTSDPEIQSFSFNTDDEITLELLIRNSPNTNNQILASILVDPTKVFGHPVFAQKLTAAGIAIAPTPATTIGIAIPVTTVSPAGQPAISLTPATLAPLLKNIKIKKTVVRNFIKDFGGITANNLNQLLALNDAAAINEIVDPILPAPLGRAELNANNQVDWDDKPTVYQSTSIAYGHLLHYKQQWIADGYSLGDLVYSLPLAPGQKKQIVVFDWERRESAANSQEIDFEESLQNSLSRDRDINEIASGVVNERLSGSSTATVKSGAAGIGFAIGPLVLGAAGGISNAKSSATQNSMRSTAVRDNQHLSDKTVQSASAVRSQRSTVIQTVSQGERFQVSAESVANYNHCHAITIQYFEVLRHFKVQQKLADAQECLFVPLPITIFDINKARRWREILIDSLINRKLLPAFDSLQRVNDRWLHSDFPDTTFAAEQVLNITGNLKIKIELSCPSDLLKEEKIFVTTTTGIQTVTKEQTFIVPQFDQAKWDWMQPLLGDDALTFYNSFIKDQPNRDDIFRRKLGDRIAQKIVNGIIINAQADTGFKFPIANSIDTSLNSTFHNAVPLSVTFRSGLTAIPRQNFVNIDFALNSNTKLPDFTKITIVNGSASYRTKHRADFLFRYSTINDDLNIGDSVTVFSGPTHDELRNPKEEDTEYANNLIHHLNSNLEYYHKMIWMYMTPERRFMLLDGIKVPGPKGNGRSVASLVENKLIGVVGNSLVLPVIPGVNLNPDFEPKILDANTGDIVPLIDYYNHEPSDPLRISVPTKGVFAEAMMGKCNSCEVKDETRFWRWEESPIPDNPTTINPVTTPTPVAIQPDLTATPLSTPVINIQNAPAAPDPGGLTGILNLLGKGDTFRDVTGLTENQKNALEGLKQAFSTASTFGSLGLEKAKFDKMAGLLEKGKISKADFDKSQKDGKTVNPELQDTIDANEAAKDGKISPEEAQKLKPKSDEEKLELAKKHSDFVDDKVKSGKISAVEGEKLQIGIAQSATNTKPAEDSKATDEKSAEEKVELHPVSVANFDFKNHEGYQNKLQFKITTKGSFFKVEFINNSNDFVTISSINPSNPDNLELENLGNAGIISGRGNLKISPNSATLLYQGNLLPNGVTDDFLPSLKSVNFGVIIGNLANLGSTYILPFNAGKKFKCIFSGFSDTTLGETFEDLTITFNMNKGTEVRSISFGIVVDIVRVFNDKLSDADGKLIDNEDKSELGNLIRIRNLDDTYITYGNLSKGGIKVNIGDSVSDGDLIALSGNTGASSQAQLSLKLEVLDFENENKTLKLNFRNHLEASIVLKEGKCYELNTGEVPCT